MSANPLHAARLLQLLRDLKQAIPPDPIDASGIGGKGLKTLRGEIEETIAGLQRVILGLDPVKQPPHVLDPSDPEVIGRLIAETLLKQSREPLKSLPRFYGSGIYAIYYKGEFAAYSLISGSNIPLYVGKADPATPGAVNPKDQGTRLWGRLQDHRKSIVAANNLDIDDFECRYLVVKSAWQVTAETYLIDEFAPVWNSEVNICYGFGKHGDAAETRANTKSPWDTLHPGRKWAEKSKDNPLSKDEIIEKIIAHLRRVVKELKGRHGLLDD